MQLPRRPSLPQLPLALPKATATPGSSTRQPAEDDELLVAAQRRQRHRDARRRGARL